MHSKEGKCSIICFGDSWDTFWRRRQQIMYRLSKQDWVDKVLFVEFTLTVASFLKFCFGKGDYGTRKKWPLVLNSGFVRRFDEKIIVVTPLILFSHWRFDGSVEKIVLGFNQFCQMLLLKFCLWRYKMKNSVLWVSHPFFTHGFIGKFGERCFIYDCTEDIPLKQSYASAKLGEKVATCDWALTWKANVIFVNSRPLYESKISINPNTHLLPNAVDLEHFRLPKRKEKPRDLDGILTPILGYIGTLDLTTDLELLEYVARKRKEWSLAIIAANALTEPKEQSLLKRITSLGNVFFLGEKSYEELPAYIHHFNVCLRAYKVDQSTRSQSSLTLLYFLASGKPVVSTNTAGAENFPKVVKIARDYDEYISSIQQALSEKDPDAKRKRIESVSSHSWDNRLETVISSFKEILGD